MAFALFKKSVLERLHPRKSTDENLEFYYQERENFQTGDLLFFSGDHWLSGLIRARSRSAWSHVGMVIRLEELNRVFLVESILEVGVRLVPLSFVMTDYDGEGKAYKGRVAWCRHAGIHADKEKQIRLKEFSLDNLTKQYDRDEYWRILWRTFTGSKELFEDSKYTCAEFIWEAYKHAKEQLPKERGYFISPGAFYRLDEMMLQGMLI